MLGSVARTLEVLPLGVLELELRVCLHEVLVLGVLELKLSPCVQEVLASLRGAGVSRAVSGGATIGGAGAPSAGPGDPGTGRVAADGTGSEGGASGALGSGQGATADPDTTPPPHPYPTQHYARLRRAPATAAGGAAGAAATIMAGTTGAAGAAVATVGARAAAAGGGAAATGAGAAAAVAAVVAAAGAAAKAAAYASCLWPLGPWSPLPFLPPPPLLLSTVPRFLLLTPPRLFSLVLSLRCPLLFLTLGLLALLSALTASLSTLVTDYYRTYCLVLSRVLASLVTDPRASLSSVSALTVTVTEFATTRRLDYATRVVDAPPTRPLAFGGESALGCDALEDRQIELGFLASASPSCLCLGPWASQWRAAMDAKMASYRSTGTYVNKVSPPGANVVVGMWIFNVKRPPESPPFFKARYVARGFSQHEGVDFFPAFAPSPKMTTLCVLLQVAAQ
ncbi:unnamed protein product [Closterium sp. Yama58-4]|nr:unnamed protein product [Closterium sp. Yama58-4]